MAKRRRKKSGLASGFFALLLCGAVLFGLVIFLEKALPTEPEEPVLALNPYDESDFYYDGDYLTCVTAESTLGVDVSSHQGKIDWQRVKAAGISFAMIRVGYRGYESGLITADELAQENYQGAKAAGLKVGAYFFSQAVSEEEALEEAEFVLDQVATWDVQLPLVFDWEYVSDTARTAAVDGALLTRCTHAFAERIRQAGYRPMLYFNPHLAQDYLDLEQLAEYPFWLALYSDRMTFPYRIQMWQYTQEGTVPGIKGKVDVNLWLE